MREKEFEENLKEMGFEDGIRQEIYWYLDEDENVVLDIEEMEREFEIKVKEIDECLNK